MTALTFEERLQERQITELRASDESTRANAGAVAIIDVAVLVRDLVTFMPEFSTEPESKAYLEAIKDIGIQVNAAQLQHDKATGELRPGGRHLVLPSEMVDAAYRQRTVARTL